MSTNVLLCLNPICQISRAVGFHPYYVIRVLSQIVVYQYLYSGLSFSFSSLSDTTVTTNSLHYDIIFYISKKIASLKIVTNIGHFLCARHTLLLLLHRTLTTTLRRLPLVILVLYMHIRNCGREKSRSENL